MLTREGWLRIGWVLLGALIVLCLIPPFPLVEGSARWNDKAFHAGAYAGLMWWFTRALPPPRWATLAGALAVLGVAIEGAQWLTPYRSPALADVFANGCGLGLGWLAARSTPSGFPPFRPAE